MIRILVLAIAMAHAPVVHAGLRPEHPRPMPPRTLIGPLLMLTDGDGHYVTLVDEPHDD